MLSQRIVVCDGAMGSQLYEQLGPLPCFEQANLDHAELVLQIHLAYINAGAEIIETNTFGANRVKLSALGLGEKVGALNHRAVKIAREAREAAGKNVLIAGSIGPLGKGWKSEDSEAASVAQAAFREQAEALEERGVDLFLLETFPTLRELSWAVETIRSFTSLPLIAQLAYTFEAKTLGGDEPAESTRRLRDLGADVVGANCSVGPQDTLAVLHKLSDVKGIRFSAQPNVGFPHRVGDRVIYPKSSAEYFAQFACEAVKLGAGIVGGCCGTTPVHIQAMAEAVKNLAPREKVVKTSAAPATITVEQPPLLETERAPASTFYQKILAGKFPVSIELDPPKGTNMDRLREAAKTFQASGKVDAVDVNSGSLARVGMDAVMLSAEMEKAGIETIPHLTTRDMNIIGLQANLLGAWAVCGIRNMLCITGDPPSLGDHPEVIGVYEVDAVGLVRLIARLNKGTDWAGKTLGGHTNFAISVAVNPTADDLDDELRRFEQKIEAGAHFAMTQPIFDPKIYDEFLKRLGGKSPIPIVAGLWPLSSYKLAVRLHNEVPGVVVPEAVQKALKEAGPKARDKGFDLAREMYAWARENTDGAYIIPPFKKYEAALEVLP